MPRNLIITSGDAAAERISQTGISAEILPWRDILYEGPVPLTDTPAELSAIRAGYLAAHYAQPGRDVAREFAERDRLLARHADFDTVTLWFEHDLHDMLQLLQLLDYFVTSGRKRDALRLIHTDRHLVMHTPDELLALAANAKPAGTARLNQAREAWRCWREPDPRAWAALLHRPRLGLKHLWSGVLQSLGHFPIAGKGISNVERFVIRTIAEGPASPIRLFDEFCRHCDRVHGSYMGDWSFFAMLDRLAARPSPLIAGLDGGPFTPSAPETSRRAWLESMPALTVLGRRVLAGDADWGEHTRIDRWVGGRHITNDHLWQYDSEDIRFIAPHP